MADIPSQVCALHRHILASLHFNENIHREKQTSKNGETYMRVVWPKYKLGEEVVKERSVPATYGKNRTPLKCH